MSREKSREEARFAKGDVGVDGQSTDEETRDPAELERDKAREQLLRGRTYLGRELLTWLLWRSESGDPLGTYEGEPVQVLFLNRLVLRGLHGEVVELAAKGTVAPYSVQVRRALDDGLLVHLARMRVTWNERTWETSLDAEFLDCKSVKLPELLTEEDDDRLSERLDLTEQLSSMLDGLVESFLAVRTSKAWAREVEQLKAWMKGEVEPSPVQGKTIARARRAASA